MDIHALYFILMWYIMYLRIRCQGFSTPCCRKTAIFEGAMENMFHIAENVICNFVNGGILCKVLFLKLQGLVLGLWKIFSLSYHCCSIHLMKSGTGLYIFFSPPFTFIKSLWVLRKKNKKKW